MINALKTIIAMTLVLLFADSNMSAQSIDVDHRLSIDIDDAIIGGYLYEGIHDQAKEEGLGGEVIVIDEVIEDEIDPVLSGDSAPPSFEGIAGRADGGGDLFALSAEVAVFPNPAVDLVSISTTQPGDFTVRVFSLAGQKVYEQYFTKTAKATIDVSNWADSIYMVQYESGSDVKTLKLKVSR